MSLWSKNVTAKVSEFNDKTVGKVEKAVSDAKDKVEDATGINVSAVAKDLGKSAGKYGISAFIPCGSFAVLTYDLVKNKDSVFDAIKGVKDIGKSKNSVDLISSSSKTVEGVSSLTKLVSCIYDIFK